MGTRDRPMAEPTPFAELHPHTRPGLIPSAAGRAARASVTTNACRSPKVLTRRPKMRLHTPMITLSIFDRG
jgi:hypothetical protein